MKILQINKLYYPWIGGIEKVVQQLAEGLDKKSDLEIEVLVCRPKGIRKIEKVNEVKVYQASSFGIVWGLPISFDFFRIFKKLKNKYDIIDFHHPFPLGDLVFFLFKSKARLVVHYHSDIVRQKILEFFFKPLIFNTLQRAEKIIISNPNLIKNSLYLRKFKEKCVIIPYGIDLKKFEKFDEREVKKIKEKYGNFVLFVGRLNYYKGVEYLINAMKKVTANLVIIGQGVEKNNLELKIKELGLENKIFFLPPQEEKELISFYQAAKVFILPSIFKSEAFGIVLIEAMACGSPVVSTELSTGTSWVNIDGKTGFVVQPRDSKALKEAINRILEDKSLFQKFSENAKKRAEKEFSLEKMLRATEGIYKLQ